MTPLILAFDTTHEWGSLALSRGLEILEEISLQEPSGFAHVIYGHLERLLKRHSLQGDDIDCFASAAGPGSFTGVRVGLAAVKGLAEACRKPAVAVSNLEALASYGTAPVRAVVLDARRDEIYGAIYDAERRLIRPEMVAKFPAWLETIPQIGVEFISDDAGWLRILLAGTRVANAPIIAAPRAQAAAIARIAFIRFCRGEATDPAALDANYVRRSDAELFWKE